jgi:uncharacterized delta-60 repeat protein
MFVDRRVRTLPRVRTLIGSCCAAIALTGALAPVALAATPGTTDTSFGHGGVAGAGAGTRFFGTAVQSDGKVVAVGETGVGSNAGLLVARFGTNGALDGSFGSGGLVRGPSISGALDPNSIGRAVAIQSDGKIVVVGKATGADGTGTDGIVIERYTSNGSLDTSFGSGGVVLAAAGQLGDGYGVAIQSDGKIVASGTADASGSGGVTPRVAVVRVNANGALDSSFGSHGLDILDLGAYSMALAVAVQSDGKIVIAGSQAPGLQVPNALIARLTASGALDPSFNGDGAYTHQYAQGAANSGFNALAIQSDGKIVAVGAATAGNTSANAIIARFTTGGTPDGSFGSGGVAFSASAINTAATGAVPGATGVGIASNGDIIAGGTISSAGLHELAVWAFTSHGAPDGSFGTHGAAVTSFGTVTQGEGQGLAIGSDGKIVVAGDAKAITQTYTAEVVRYNGFAPPPPPALKASLKGVSNSYKSSSVVKHGLKVGVNCNEACAIKVTVTVSSSTAKKLHLKTHGKKPVTILTGKGSLSKSGTKSITLKLSKKLGKSIEKQKRVGLNLQVSVRSSVTHKTKTLKKGVTLKR